MLLHENSDDDQLETLDKLVKSAKELDLIIHKLNQIVQSKFLD